MATWRKIAYNDSQKSFPNVVQILVVQVLFLFLTFVSKFDKCWKREDQHHIPYQDNILHKLRIAFSLLPQQECSGCSNTKERTLIRNKNFRSHTEDTGNSSISYSINILVSKFSSERDHILFPSYVAYVSSQMKWKIETNEEQKMYRFRQA